ncbi:conserved virulence factor C family protein [Aquibacillus koreensis]|uniref:Conserved virulence factor C family protein n=1 Tax=Aquibacillus koreensis TaxID=279446 RepID=A0A9X3WKR8_9BACI|nr:conserved virulence factor C family protein [Aquibacillus koreensis]MCT2535967.1 conserved virulence factor C family protein [Aquibacillus koreensis]MDC3420423.1 conserved virulence factor C family protein [Aquibacillus koreensis]
MKIVSIEPTPSPHSMKINLNELLPDNETRNYKQGDDLSSAPMYIQSLFQIYGVKGIYQVVDFIALERHPKVDWEVILPEVRKALGTEEVNLQESIHQRKVEATDEAFGEVKVRIQMFRNIPMQVKLDDGNEEKRFGLPAIFMDAAMEASAASPNFVMERKWVEQRPRYGPLEEIGNDIVDELSASYDQDRLNQLVKIALDNDSEAPENQTTMDDISLSVFHHADWKVRYAALDHMEPSFDKLPFLAKALEDEKASIRRLATAYLGMIEGPEVLPYLYKALKDKAVTVRRTAGDCISDLGFKQAMPEMIASLSDSNRLVRWRAAMFLYEIGDETAIPALEAAVNDPEFEVRMQVNMALERIKGGEAGKGSVWHQMTQATRKNNN